MKGKENVALMSSKSLELTNTDYMCFSPALLRVRSLCLPMGCEEYVCGEGAPC